MLQDFPEGNVLEARLDPHYLRLLGWDMNLEGSLWTAAALSFLVSPRFRDFGGMQGYGFQNGIAVGVGWPRDVTFWGGLSCCEEPLVASATPGVHLRKNKSSATLTCHSPLARRKAARASPLGTASPD